MRERNAHAEAGHVSCEEAHEIASRFNASHWRGKAGLKECARYSIPADPRRDDDIRLGAFIERAAKMERDLELLAQLRAHPDFDAVAMAVENTRNRTRATMTDPIEGYDLLLKLLRGDHG